MKLGEVQILTVTNVAKKNYTVSDGEENALLPKDKASKAYTEDDKVKVFIYRENDGSLMATEEDVYIEVGEVKKLPIVSKTKIGYFVNIGIDRDVLLPFSETTERVNEGEHHLVSMYVDKSNRLAMTMNVKNYLSTDSPYKSGDHVKGTVYSVNPKIGAFVAVDNKYDGLVRTEDLKGIYQPGDSIEVRVGSVLPDGKLNLSMREVAHIEMVRDADIILDLLNEYRGELPIGDKSKPKEIRRLTGLSKSAFKRAVGRLYKEGKAIPGDYNVRLKR